MRKLADKLTPRPLARRLTLFSALGAVLGLATCVEVPAQEPGPGPMQAAFAPGADLPATARAAAGDVPLAVPVTAGSADPVAEAPEAFTPEPVFDLEAIHATPTPEDTRLQEVFWTAHDTTTLGTLARAWGIRASALSALNPDYKPDDTVDAGTRLLVYRHDPEKPTLSIGAPNRGKLRNGMPLPEGPGWRLRTHRPRTYGAVHTIHALVQAFETFSERYPDGPMIRVGELARRTGGKVPPHRSHRTGRDIDIGYIFRGIDDGEHRWRYMNTSNFDAEKNWALVDAILKTGQVQTIYMSKKLQKLLHKEAQKHLADSELAALFEYPITPESPHAVIQHWRGHTNHMHVRFVCEPGNRRCRSRSG